MLYTTNSSGVEGYVLTELARQLGWEVFEAPKLSKHGVPFVKNLYADAAERVPNCVYYAYSNGDILYSHDIIKTLEEISKVMAKIQSETERTPCPENVMLWFTGNLLLNLSVKEF